MLVFSNERTLTTLTRIERRVSDACRVDSVHDITENSMKLNLRDRIRVALYFYEYPVIVYYIYLASILCRHYEIRLILYMN